MKFVFVVHCHQPTGNLDSVIDRIVDDAYMPLLETLAAVPAMRIGAHYSGTLLDWAQTHRADLIEELYGSTEQIEFIGGGMHDPILPVLPDGWRRRQLERHRQMLESVVQHTPTGIWLAERVWEPTLAWLLHDVGMRYTLLDETLFEVAGAEPTIPAAVDHLGRTLRVLPISRRLREMLPVSDVDEILQRLREVHDSDPNALVVAADDGEKFGAWEGTHERVYRQGWLRDLFEAVTTQDWIEVLQPAEAAELPTQRVALGAGSYSQMNSWLTADPEQRGWPAPWKEFLTRYPESNVMYRKMLALTDTKLTAEAVDHVLAAQTGDAYWHGAYGGIYLPHLRSAVNERLLAARRAVDSGRRTRTWSDLTVKDWDADGEEEIHVELPDQSWVLHRGGALHYYDDKPSGWCVADVVARHQERYHSDTKQFDDLERQWLIDRLTGMDADPSVLFEPHAGPARFELETAESSRGSVRVRMAAAGDWKLVKSLTARDRQLELTYEIEEAPAGRFGPELPVAVWEGAARLRVDGGDWLDLQDSGAITGHRFRFEQTGRGTQVVIDLRLPGAMFYAPLVTAVRTEQGFTDVFQGVILWPHFLTGGSGTYTMSISIVDAAPPPE